MSFMPGGRGTRDQVQLACNASQCASRGPGVPCTLKMVPAAQQLWWRRHTTGWAAVYWYETASPSGEAVGAAKEPGAGEVQAMATSG
jgi:hypothetical protein